MKKKIVKDVLYNYIEIEDPFLDFIEHHSFQRLRFIKQNGFSYLVYPNAMHTRFVHSLGVFHLTKLAANYLDIGNNKEELIIASLLHDIGHGPFSHVSEKALFDIIKKDHEELGIKTMKEEMEDLFAKSSIDLKKVVSFVKGKKEGIIIAGDIGTDRLDYLNRDSYFAGLNFGLIDSERIIRFLEYKKGKLFVDEKAIFNVYQLIISRFFMFKAFYNHKISELATTMFKEALIEMCNYINPEKIMKMTDDELMVFGLKSDNKKIKEIFEAIYLRKLPKAQFCKEIKEKVDDNEIEEMQKELRTIYNYDKIWVFRIGTTFKQPTIEFKNGKKLFSSIIIKDLPMEEERLSKIYIFSYKNLPNIENKVKRMLNNL
jgi:HD superfamily phosphohydrolase